MENRKIKSEKKKTSEENKSSSSTITLNSEIKSLKNNKKYIELLKMNLDAEPKENQFIKKSKTHEKLIKKKKEKNQKS